ncbi:unnamed protein product [Protopolystoma xenopodis]|uniref:Uncharacterized protein n=1 Tax=Protopolystoma xenopodis TaxID=117903 RepID=A0A3S5AEU5_9PLAT|nr:unnamed protein product [Protopolystoma xenopodis]
MCRHDGGGYGGWGGYTANIKACCRFFLFPRPLFPLILQKYMCFALKPGNLTTNGRGSLVQLLNQIFPTLSIGRRRFSIRSFYTTVRLRIPASTCLYVLPCTAEPVEFSEVF